MPARVVSASSRKAPAARSGSRRPSGPGGQQPGLWKILAEVLVGLVVVAVIGRMALGMLSAGPAGATTANDLPAAAAGAASGPEAPEAVAERVVRAYTLAGVLPGARPGLERVLKADVREDARKKLGETAAANLRLTNRVAGQWLKAAGRTEPVELLATLATRAQRAPGGVVVDGYDVQVAGVEGRRAQGTFRSWRVSLTEQDGRWVATGLRSRRGPAPESTSVAAGPDDPLVAELRDMGAER